MTDTFTATALGEQNDIQTAVDAGVAIAKPSELSGGIYSVLVPAGAKRETVDLRAVNPHLDVRPARKTGQVLVHNSEAFIAYLDKHTVDETEVWTDAAKAQLVAVLNAHGSARDVDDAVAADADAGWGDHRCKLELIKTPEWEAWERLDRKWLTQQDFAEHLEDNAQDVVDPDPATMLEVAEHFVATIGTDFKSVERLSSGEVKFNYEETISARAGQTGDVEVPTAFALSLTPFVGGVPVEVTARFRYRLRSGTLSLSYHLLRPHEALQAAFDREVDAVRASVSAPVYAGRPE